MLVVEGLLRRAAIWPMGVQAPRVRCKFSTQIIFKKNIETYLLCPCLMCMQSFIKKNKFCAQQKNPVLYSENSLN
jgi:hypothetical protein